MIFHLYAYSNIKKKYKYIETGPLGPLARKMYACQDAYIKDKHGAKITQHKAPSS